MALALPSGRTPVVYLEVLLLWLSLSLGRCRLGSSSTKVLAAILVGVEPTDRYFSRVIVLLSPARFWQASFPRAEPRASNPTKALQVGEGALLASWKASLPDGLFLRKVASGKCSTLTNDPPGTARRTSESACCLRDLWGDFLRRSDS